MICSILYQRFLCSTLYRRNHTPAQSINIGARRSGKCNPDVPEPSRSDQPNRFVRKTKISRLRAHAESHTPDHVRPAMTNCDNTHSARRPLHSTLSLCLNTTLLFFGFLDVTFIPGRKLHHHFRPVNCRVWPQKLSSRPFDYSGTMGISFPWP